MLEWGLIPDTKHPLRQAARHEKEPTSVSFHVTISQSGLIAIESADLTFTITLLLRQHVRTAFLLPAEF